MAKLTAKRIAFAEAVASGQTQAGAYRIAFNAQKMLPKTIQECASKLMADSQIKERVAELRAPIALKAQITLESHLEDLQRLRNMAAKEKQYGAAIAAEIARGKAAGVHIEKNETAITIPTFVVRFPNASNGD